MEPFVVSEEEGAIRDDGAADAAAELMLVQDGVDRRKVVARIETSVPVELVPRAMELVRAGLRQDVNDATPGAADLGRIQVGLDADFRIASIDGLTPIVPM